MSQEETNPNECLSCVLLREELDAAKAENAALREELNSANARLNESTVRICELERNTQGASLDRDKIQVLDEYGVNPLHLAAKPKLKETFFSARQALFVPTPEEAETRELITFVIENVFHNDEKYPKLSLLVKLYTRRGGYVCVCPFEPGCKFTERNSRPSKMKEHLKRHFDIIKYPCLFCKRGFLTYSNQLSSHLKSCMPPTSYDKKKRVEEPESKRFPFSDVRILAKKIWELQSAEKPSFVDPEDPKLIVELGISKIKRIKVHFPYFFKEPTFNDEFEKVLNTVRGGEVPNKTNPGKAYLVIQLIDPLPTLQQAPQHAIYAGSETNSSGNTSSSKKKIENAEGLNTYHKHVNHAKKQGAKFVKVHVVKFILDDQKQNSKSICPRYTIEDALKRCIEALSDKTFNQNPINRNEFCETREWPACKLVLFGFWIFRRSWPDILRQMQNEEILL